MNVYVHIYGLTSMLMLVTMHSTHSGVVREGGGRSGSVYSIGVAHCIVYMCHNRLNGSGFDANTIPLGMA